jgi:hypothetical protein
VALIVSPWNPFPPYQAMDRNVRIKIETQSYYFALDFEHRHLQHSPEAIGSSDDDDSWYFLVVRRRVKLILLPCPGIHMFSG